MKRRGEEVEYDTSFAQTGKSVFPSIEKMGLIQAKRYTD